MLVTLCDWRTFIRKIRRLPAIDTVFISNIRDEADKRIFFGKKELKDNHSNQHRIWLNHNNSGRIRCIHSLTEDLFTLSGRKRYKLQINSAINWAISKKSKVILFGAATKRIFNDAIELKENFPNLLFTIGDNGTVLLLKNEALELLDKCGIDKDKATILIIGPYGFLGESMVRILLSEGFLIVGVGANTAGAERIKKEYGIPVYSTFNDAGKADAVIACTHSEKVRLNSSSIEMIRRKNKKLVVVDVSEPSNYSEEEYLKSRNHAIRIDAGNAHSNNLKYVLGYFSYKMLRLQRGVTFGCFAEAMALAAELKCNGDSNNLTNRNWFEVNEANMAVIEGLFDKYKITHPSFRCFGKEIKDYNINISPIC